MKNEKQFLLFVVLWLCLGNYLLAHHIPLVYDVEHSGRRYPVPVLPSINELPVVETLTDPFQWSDGNGRSTQFKDWCRRRAEIAHEIEHYEIGQKPFVPRKNISVDLLHDTLIVSSD